MLVNVAGGCCVSGAEKKNETRCCWRRLRRQRCCRRQAGGRSEDSGPITLRCLVQAENIPVDENWTRDTFERTLRELTDLTVKAANPRIIGGVPEKLELIVWPESPAPFFANDPLFREPVSEMARQTRSWGGDGCDWEYECDAERRPGFGGIQFGRAG